MTNPFYGIAYTVYGCEIAGNAREVCGEFLRQVDKTMTMLAYSPKKSLLEPVVHRPKMGFFLPMATWLSGASHMHTGSDLHMLTAPEPPWAWAVLAEITGCG